MLLSPGRSAYLSTAVIYRLPDVPAAQQTWEIHFCGMQKKKLHPVLAKSIPCSVRQPSSWSINGRNRGWVLTLNSCRRVLRPSLQTEGFHIGSCLVQVKSADAAHKYGAPKDDWISDRGATALRPVISFILML